MINFFNQSEVEKARKQKTKVLIIYFITLAFVIAIFSVVFITYLTFAYEDPRTPALKLSFEVLLVVYVIFSYVYLTIKYKRVNKYYKYLVNQQTGLKEKTEGKFLCYNNTRQIKDGVDFKSFKMLTISIKTGKEVERQVLVDYEKDFPTFTEGQKIKVTTQGNVLFGYEIME
ncbi:MAG: hypothetical protein E7342_02745 [Clostridiales bacterium]|nr:hypothetical protein [Clostridiales bacterium]